MLATEAKGYSLQSTNEEARTLEYQNSFYNSPFSYRETVFCDFLFLVSHSVSTANYIAIVMGINNKCS